MSVTILPSPGVLRKSEAEGSADNFAHEHHVNCVRLRSPERNPRTLAELMEQARLQVRTDFRQALALADAALDLASELNDAIAVGRSLRLKGNALYASGRNREALELHQQALDIFTQHDDREEQALTLSARMQPLLLIGEYDQALRDAEAARAIFSALGNRRRCARLDINVGNVLHRQDRFEEAIARYNSALAQLLEEKDAEGIAGALSNLAVCLISTNDFPRALEANQRARALCRENGMPLLAAQAEYNIAYLYFLRGEYNIAMQMLLEVQRNCEQIGDAYHHALCNLDLSEMYLELNLSDEAAEMAEQGSARFDELGMGYEAAKSMAFLAIARRQQKRTFVALDLFASARQRFEREQNRSWVALVDLYRAMVLAEEGRIYEARQLAAAALQFFEESRLAGKAVHCHLVLARLSLREGDLERARQHCDNALDFDLSEVPSLAFHAHFVHGCVDTQLGATDQAITSFQAARQALEQLRGGLRLDELKVAFLEDKLEVYEYLVELTLDAGNPGTAAQEESFTYIEEAKSRSLLELMLSSQERPTAAAEGQSELVRRVRRLRRELNWYYQRIEHEQMAASHSSERVTKLQQALNEREREFVRAMRELPGSDAGARLASVLPLEQVRAALAPGVVLVEYFRAHERLLAVVISRDRFEILPVAMAASVNHSLQLLELQLSKFSLGADYVRRFSESLHKSVDAHLASLYRELVEPLGVDDAAHLVVIPHEGLHRLPFHALRDKHGYLIDRVSLSYAPSASVHALCRSAAPSPYDGALVLGIADDHAPAIEHEARSVASMFTGATLLLGCNATYEQLRQAAPRTRLLHIASHGYFRADNPRLSGIHLGDFHVSAHDLAQLQLSADLVALSGCATGLNAVSGADELIGLERALLSAGARSLLLSLWDVHDESAAEFMKCFYAHFQNGSGASQSVRRAALEIKRRYPHPYYWAPFFIVGNHGCVG